MKDNIDKHIFNACSTELFNKEFRKKVDDFLAKGGKIEYGERMKGYEITPEDEKNIKWKTKIVPLDGFASITINPNIHVNMIIADTDAKQLIVSYYEKN